MHRPPKLRIAFLLLAALLIPLLVACGDDDGNDNADTRFAPSETAVPREAANQPDAPASSPVDNLVARKSSTEPASDLPEEPTVPAGIVIGTAESDEPIVKNTPSGPVPTQVPPPPSAFDEDGDGFYTADELEQAIRYRFPDYEWPDNYQLTADILIKHLDLGKFPPGTGFEVQAEYTNIGMYHMCAWQFAMLDAVHEDDPAVIDEALYQLEDIGLIRNRFFAHDQEAEQVFTEMYDRAALGDPADLQQWVDNNCGFEREAFITPGTPVGDSSPAATSNGTEEAVR